MERIEVKILGLSCAHRVGKNTAWLVQYSLKAAEKFGREIGRLADVETEFIDLARKRIEPCGDCQRFCTPNQGLPWEDPETPQDSRCVIKGDYMEQLLPKVAEADGFIFGCPVYTHSVTSKFTFLFQRLRAAMFKGYFTNKPAGAVTTAAVPLGGGGERCLIDMNTSFMALEMIPVSWALGATGVSGLPYGVLPRDDNGKVIGQKNDKLGNWMAVLVGRRVAELTVMLKLARNEFGDVYTTKFMQTYQPPHGGESWAWSTLDKEDEEFMMSLQKTG